MFENIANFFKKLVKSEKKETPSKDTAKERLHLVLMQDRANVSADFLELMKQEIIEVIKKYIEVEESAIDVRLTNEISEDGTTGAPSLYANIPIVNIKNSVKKDVENNLEEKKEVKEKEEIVKNTDDKNKGEESSSNENIKQNEKEDIKPKKEESIEEKCDEEKIEKKENESSIKQRKDEVKKEDVNSNKSKTNLEEQKSKNTKSNIKNKKVTKQ